MNITRRFKTNQDIVFKEEGEGGFLFDPETGNLKYLNRSAKESFLILQEQPDPEVVIGYLHDKYPEQDQTVIRQDVKIFLQELTENGFMERVEENE